MITQGVTNFIIADDNKSRALNNENKLQKGIAFPASFSAIAPIVQIAVIYSTAAAPPEVIIRV